MKLCISSKAALSSVIQKGETLLGAETLPSKSHGLCVIETPPFFALFLCFRPNQGSGGEFEPSFVLPRESERSSVLVHHA